MEINYERVKQCSTLLGGFAYISAGVLLGKKI